jgi:hypothetical protein
LLLVLLSECESKGSENKEENSHADCHNHSFRIGPFHAVVSFLVQCKADVFFP